jgi:hypothetical protein
MINNILNALNIGDFSNINSDNIIPMLSGALIVIAVIAKILMQLKEALTKALRVAGVVIAIVLIIGIQQGTLEEWVTNLTTFIK